MWGLLGSVAPRAILSMYAQCPADTVTGMAVTRLFAALEAVVSPAAEHTADCKG